ncbi:ferrous iron transport protein B [Helicobacter monodelphidis]|uniref:ferrous iron transport protein B n=1 Tax=Helicobacter sp. 15-1451 TaxID=2004995 RepID=UPI000DCD1B9A|nr:ferrous iron transport protein B [Helicobacter sp. 15-1451]RAX59209.1 ferrous iron transport protein B [Helicobacter sp. 15-1451]
MTKKMIRVALVGQPNVGKSMLINAICGSNMRVGNFSGVTVEKSYAYTKFRDYTIEVIDLPGIYSLEGYTEEEKLTRQFLSQNQNEYDLILNILDVTNLERNLMLSSQLLEVPNKRLILALNMSDEAEKEGIETDIGQMQSLLGINVIDVSAVTKFHLDRLLELIVESFEKDTPIVSKRTYSDQIEEEIVRIVNFIDDVNAKELHDIPLKSRDIAIGLLKRQEYIYNFLQDKPIWLELSKYLNQALENLYQHYETRNMTAIFSADAQNFASGLCAKVHKRKQRKATTITQKIDYILINRFLGLPIFLLFMWVLFYITFDLGSIPMDYIEAFFGAIGDWVKENIQNENIASIIADGAIGGVGAVVMFLPNIMILFLGIAILETTGYMARVAFLLDGIFHRFGLHGKSFIPLITGFGCSVPAFMATRILKNRSDRILTLFIVNFMSCGARLPIYVLFIGAFFPEEQAANWLFGIYILGAILGLVAAKILKLTTFKGDDEPFVMEMPKYRLPSLKLIWKMVWGKALMYLKKAGTYILAASLLIWFASNYPYDKETVQQIQAQINLLENQISALQEDYETDKKQDSANLPNDELNALQEELDTQNAHLSTVRLDGSYLALVGKGIEPFFAPFGFDWRPSVALLSGLAAKEVAVATMGVLYSLGDEVDEENDSLRKVLKENFTLPSAVAFILFVMLYNPCLAATAVFAKETGSWQYAFYLFVFTTLVAYLVALIGYTFANLLFS